MNIYQYVKSIGFETACKKFGLLPVTLRQYCAGRRLPKPETMLKIYKLTKGKVSTKAQLEYFVAMRKMRGDYARAGRRMAPVSFEN